MHRKKKYDMHYIAFRDYVKLESAIKCKKKDQISLIPCKSMSDGRKSSGFWGQ